MKNECDTVKKKLEEVIALNQQMQKENKVALTQHNQRRKKMRQK